MHLPNLLSAITTRQTTLLSCHKSSQYTSNSSTDEGDMYTTHVRSVLQPTERAAALFCLALLHSFPALATLRNPLLTPWSVICVVPKQRQNEQAVPDICGRFVSKHALRDSLQTFSVTQANIHDREHFQPPAQGSVSPVHYSYRLILSVIYPGSGR